MTEQAVTFSKKRWIILIITIVSTFMNTLDSSIVNVALPTMAGDLGVDTGRISWVMSIYLIVITVCILLFGRLGDLIGHTKVFRLGLLIFTIGSLLCGFSNSFIMLLLSRAVQAVGASAGMANNQGIITRAFPLEERGRALGFIGTAVALGTLVGPSLGGLILSFTGWEYLFWINVPIGLAAYIANMKFATADTTRPGEKLDWVGSLLIVCTLVPLFLALELGQTRGYSAGVLMLFPIAGMGFLLFLRVETRRNEPLLDLNIFRNRHFSLSVFCAFTSFVAISCSNILLPFYLQNVLGLSAGQAGLFMTLNPLILVLAAPISGYLTDKIGPEILTVIGLGLNSLGLFLMSTLNETPLYFILGAYIVLMAAGNGLFQTPNTTLVMSSLPREKLGVGGSVNALTRNLGLSLGITLATSVLYGGMSFVLGERVTGYVAGRNDAFIFGMRLAYISAGAVCLLGAVLTAARFYRRQKQRALQAGHAGENG